jgi:hypothetical protein
VEDFRTAALLAIVMVKFSRSFSTWWLFFSAPLRDGAVNRQAMGWLNFGLRSRSKSIPKPWGDEKVCGFFSELDEGRLQRQRATRRQ